MGRRKAKDPRGGHRCHAIKVDGADVRLNCDPKALKDPEFMQAITAVVKAAYKRMKLGPKVRR